MSRYSELMAKYQDSSVSPEEGEELARLLQENEGRARTFFDELMIEVDLYESYAGIARIQAVPSRRRRWRPPQLTLAWAVAVFVLIGLVALLFSGPSKSSLPPVPVPPSAPKKVDPPVPAPVPEKKTRMYREKEEDEDRPGHEEHERGSKKAEIEREYQKGLREVERKRAQGNLKEADEKLREIERERDKKLRGLERREEDR